MKRNKTRGHAPKFPRRGSFRVTHPATLHYEIAQYKSHGWQELAMATSREMATTIRDRLELNYFRRKLA